MVCRTRGSLIAGVGLVLAVSSARAQDQGPMPNPQAMQMQVVQIRQQRPREAEAAARAFLMLVAPNLVSSLDSMRPGPARGNEPILLVDGVPQNLSDGSDRYWDEVAQLTVQFDMVQKLSQRDSVRAQSQRRRDHRAEFIKFAVDDIVRDAIRPR